MEVVVFLLLLESLGKVPSSFSFLRGCGLGCIASNPVKITVEELATLSLSSDGSAEEREREREREGEREEERAATAKQNRLDGLKNLMGKRSR